MRKFKLIPLDDPSVKPSHFNQNLTPEEEKEVLALAKASYTAEDLQKIFAEDHVGSIFFDDLLDQLKAKEKPNNEENQ